MAVGLGSIVASPGPLLPALRAASLPMSLVGGVICHREIMMDVTDAPADALAGIRTLPAVFGARNALVASMVPLLAAAAAAAARGAPIAAAPVAIQALLALRAMRHFWSQKVETAPLLEPESGKRDETDAVRTAVEMAPVCLLGSLLMV